MGADDAPVTRGLLDTSVVIDIAEHLARLPEHSAISAITVAEIHYGVLVARTAEQRARRLELLSFLEREVDSLPVDDDVARAFSRLRARAREEGRRPRSLDLLIAATAAAHELQLFTRDRDFERVSGIAVTIL